MLGEATEDGLNILASVTLVGDQDGVPSSWLKGGTDLILVVIWEANQLIEDFFQIIT